VRQLALHCRAVRTTLLRGHRPLEPTGRSLRGGSVVPRIIATTTRSAPLGNSLPFHGSSPLIDRVFTIRSRLGCHQEVPCFISALLPYVPLPLRRKEDCMLIPDPSAIPRPSPRVDRVGSSTYLDIGFCRVLCYDAAAFALCYGPHGCLPFCANPTCRSLCGRQGLLHPSFPRERSPFPWVGYNYTASSG
jgi:hypothetical protein